LSRAAHFVLDSGGLTFFFAGNLVTSNTANNYSKGIQHPLYLK